MPINPTASTTQIRKTIFFIIALIFIVLLIAAIFFGGLSMEDVKVYVYTFSEHPDRDSILIGYFCISPQKGTIQS